MPQNIFDGQSALVQVMAWCCQATSHYLNQKWPRLMIPFGKTRAQWVNSLWLSEAIWWQRYRSILAQVMAFAWLHQAIAWTNVDLSPIRSSYIHPCMIPQAQNLAWKLLDKHFVQISQGAIELKPSVKATENMKYVLHTYWPVVVDAWGHDKMAAIWQIDIFRFILLYKNCCILSQISLQMSMHYCKKDLTPVHPLWRHCNGCTDPLICSQDSN